MACVVDADCGDGDPCRRDLCVDGRCAHPLAPDGSPYGEPFCTGLERCEAGACVAVVPDLDADDDGAVSAVCGGTDCDDGDDAIVPGADERCGDGRDNDCDGAADLDDLDCGVDVVCDQGICFENPLPHGRVLAGIWPLAADDVWIGTNDGFLHDDGNDFRVVEVDVGANRRATVKRLWGAAAADIWAAASSVMLRFDGVGWRVDDDADVTAIAPVDVWGFGADDVWAVGLFGAARFDGTG